MMVKQEDLSEGWFAPMNGSRRVAHYLKNDRWLCGTRNYVPAMGIRPLMLSKTLPRCTKCEKQLEAAS